LIVKPTYFLTFTVAGNFEDYITLFIYLKARSASFLLAGLGFIISLIAF